MASPVETPLQRMELLIGEDNIIKLKQASVLIVGVGGVPMLQKRSLEVE